jgi:hypothetical protein
METQYGILVRFAARITVVVDPTLPSAIELDPEIGYETNYIPDIASREASFYY